MYSDVFTGVTPVQTQLIRYWLERRNESGRVPRERIDAGDLRAFLASISVIEFDGEGRARFRIAGSRLCDMFGKELSGLDVERSLGTHGDGFLLGLSVALERAEPVGGVTDTRLPSPNFVHAWLRLPMLDDDGRFNQVLCHDEIVHQRSLVPPDPNGMRIPFKATRTAA